MSIPSFSSFPKFESFPDLDPGPSSRTKNESSTERNAHISLDKETRARRRSKKRKRKKDDDDVQVMDLDKYGNKITGGTRTSRRRRREERDQAISNSDPYSMKQQTEAEMQEEFEEYLSKIQSNPGKMFFEDSKGDPLNITYGSLDTGHVPKYNPYSCGVQVLGVRKGLIVHFRSKEGVEIGRPDRLAQDSPLTQRHIKKLLAKKNLVRLIATPETDQMYREVDGFIRVGEREVKQEDQSYREIIEDNHDDYSILDALESENIGLGLGVGTTSVSARDEYIRNLEHSLSRDPTSISTWFQLLEKTVSEIPITIKNANTARSEIAVAVLARALAAHPQNACSIPLRLKYLKAGESIWSKKKLDEEWEEALQATNSADIYVEWLDWKMRNTTSVSDIFDNATYALRNVSDGLRNESAELAKLRVLWRIAIFFKEAGFVERAFSIFQAQAELSFNVAEEDKGKPFEERLDLLEEFWESEAIRVGESGAKGWKSWKVTGDSSVKPEEPRRVQGVDSQNPYEIWSHYEREADKSLFLPSRMETADDDDPYSVILFTDIRPFLFDLKTERGKYMFRLVWLSFLGLYIPGLSSALSASKVAWDDRWAETTFMQPQMLRSLFPSKQSQIGVTSESIAGVLVGKERTYKPSFDIIKSWQLDAVEPLEGLSVDGRYRLWNRGYTSDLDLDSLTTIRNLFDQLLLDEGEFSWTTNRLAFEASRPDLQSALYYSQAQLSSNSSSPILLAAHANLECMNKKYDKARKVYRVGITSLAQTKDPNLVYLWWGSAELEWLLSQRDAAVETILRSVNQPPERTSVNILRAKGRLEDLYRDCQLPWEARHRWIKLRFLLELLSGSLESTVRVAERLQSAEDVGGVQHESLTASVLVMVYLHNVILRNPAPPNVFRELVRKALDLYPQNSIVIGCFLESEKGEGIWGRVRTLLSGEDVLGKSLVRRLMEVWIASWDESRWLNEVERVRENFETSVISDRTKGSAILWFIYIKFEIAAGNLKKAKRIFYQALGECPMVKGLYLMAFEEEFRSVFSKRELLALYETMLERGIRVRKTLGEILERYAGWDMVYDVADEERTDDENDKEDVYDEQIQASREMRRLMPY